MVTVSQGDIWWVDLGEPIGSEPAFRRPVLVVQGDALNRSSLPTVACVALTSQMKWASAPGNVVLTKRMTGLDRDSVANVTQLVTVDRSVLEERAGKISRAKLDLVLSGLDVMLGR